MFAQRTPFRRPDRFWLANLSGLSKLYDQCPESCQNHPNSLLPGELLSQEQPGQDGDLDEHRAVDDAGRHRRERAQRVIPQCKGKGRIHHG